MTTPVTPMVSAPVTTFLSSAALKALVNQTIAADVPDGHTNAIVGTVDSNGAQVLAVFKLGTNDRWTGTGVFRHDWTGNNEVAASLVYSW